MFVIYPIQKFVVYPHTTVFIFEIQTQIQKERLVEEIRMGNDKFLESRALSSLA